MRKKKKVYEGSMRARLGDGATVSEKYEAFPLLFAYRFVKSAACDKTLSKGHVLQWDVRNESTSASRLAEIACHCSPAHPTIFPKVSR